MTGMESYLYQQGQSPHLLYHLMRPDENGIYQPFVGTSEDFEGDPGVLIGGASQHAPRRQQMPAQSPFMGALYGHQLLGPTDTAG